MAAARWPPGLRCVTVVPGQPVLGGLGDREDREMIHDAQVNLAGFVAMEPKFKKVTGDTSSVKLRVAYTARRLNRATGEWADGPTSFVNVQCWRTLADNVAVSLRKGEPVLVMGRLQIRRYEDADGNPRSTVEIDATSIGHDLTRGVAHFSRTRRAPGGTAAEIAAAELATAGLEPGDGAVPLDGGEPGDQPTRAGGMPSGDGVIDEQAVAEFAEQLTGSFGAAAGGPGRGGEPDSATGALVGTSA
jgi:single-strand DNA-binding protein